MEKKLNKIIKVVSIAMMTAGIVLAYGTVGTLTASNDMSLTVGTIRILIGIIMFFIGKIFLPHESDDK